jgi:D-alanyl-D-alanine dipeptidase
MRQAGACGPRGRARATARARVALCALALAAALTAGRAAAQDDPPPSPFATAHPGPARLVYLRDIDPSIVQDIRYASPNNFTGRRVPGYGAAECMLLQDVAEALARVQQALQQQKLSLEVYDCYRPTRAVRAFETWVKDPEVDPALKRFHPNLDKGQLIDLGYIAAVSSHSRGNTVDVTLVALPARKAQAVKIDAAYGSCAGPSPARAPDNSVDMGTSFDCFDPLSHTRAPGLTPEQQRWRQVLLDAMAAEGFHNYQKEWWHFTYMPERRGRTFDVPIVRRRR